MIVNQSLLSRLPRATLLGFLGLISSRLAPMDLGSPHISAAAVEQWLKVDRLVRGEPIGHGSFADVYSGTYEFKPGDRSQVAIKVFRGGVDLASAVRGELVALKQRLRHPRCAATKELPCVRLHCTSMFHRHICCE